MLDIGIVASSISTGQPNLVAYVDTFSSGENFIYGAGVTYNSEGDLIFGVTDNGIEDVYVAKVASTGLLNWQRKLNLTTSNLNDRSFLFNDSSDNIYSLAVGNTDPVLCKLDNNGSKVFAIKNTDGGLYSNVSVPNGYSGSICIGGGDPSDEARADIVGTGGGLIQSSRITGNDVANVRATSVANDGNFLVAGAMNIDSTDRGLIAKVSTSATLAGTEVLGGGFNNVRFFGVEDDGTNVWAVGSIEGDIVLCKFNSSLTLIDYWFFDEIQTFQYETLGSSFLSLRYANNKLYIGCFYGTVSNQNGLIVEIDPADLASATGSSFDVPVNYYEIDSPFGYQVTVQDFEIVNNRLYINSRTYDDGVGVTIAGISVNWGDSIGWSDNNGSHTVSLRQFKNIRGDDTTYTLSTNTFGVSNSGSTFTSETNSPTSSALTIGVTTS